MEAHIHTYIHTHTSQLQPMAYWLVALGVAAKRCIMEGAPTAEAIYLLVDGKESQEDTASPNSLVGPREIPHQLPAASQAADQCFTL